MYCDQRPLFRAGDDGYAFFRIPALVVSNQGTVLAFCEGRKNDCNDHGDIDLVLKRSFDSGRTWADMQIVTEGGGRTSGNPCPVVDRADGVIWLPFCRDSKRILLMKSADDGETWSEPVDITEDAMDPAWHWVFTGPGHGLQLTTGRLLIPSAADLTPRLGEIQFSYAFFSDDHGATWQIGSALDHDASDECEAVELVDGRLYMNMRSRQDKHRRAYSHSEDGGASWSPVRYDPHLPEPSCQGSIIRFTDTSQFEKNRILIATPADPSQRSHLTVRVSYDECQTWPVSKILHEGPAAYSDLAVTSERDILCLYEANEYSELVMARFDIEWLTDGKDHLRGDESSPS